MNDQVSNQALLKKYINGESTPEETGQVLEWLSTPEGMAALKNSMDVAGENAFGDVPALPQGLSDDIYARLIRRRDTGTISPRDVEHNKPGGKPVRSILYRVSKKWRVAAALAGLLLLTAGVYMLTRYNTLVYTTGVAQKEVIVLPDNSRVTLNGESSLRVLGNWEESGVRKILLRGEAFFEVVPNREKPFIVATSDIGIKVLGTSFNVKSYEEEATVETTLVSGKVTIDLPGKSGEPQVLAPSQKATYIKESSSLAVEEVDTRLYTSWKNGMLIFKDKPFVEIARELERWYGVRIKLADETSGNCRFTMKISDESLPEVLNLFASTTTAAYSIDGDQITIKGNLCP